MSKKSIRQKKNSIREQFIYCFLEISQENACIPCSKLGIRNIKTKREASLPCRGQPALIEDLQQLI
jgi:hypothetical protein